MSDLRDLISSSVEFDQPKYWVFERTSRLPIGYFKRGPDFGHFLVGAGIVFLAITLFLLSWSAA